MINQVDSHNQSNKQINRYSIWTWKVRLISLPTHSLIHSLTHPFIQSASKFTQRKEKKGKNNNNIHTYILTPLASDKYFKRNIFGAYSLTANSISTRLSQSLSSSQRSAITEKESQSYSRKFNEKSSFEIVDKCSSVHNHAFHTTNPCRIDLRTVNFCPSQYS